MRSRTALVLTFLLMASLACICTGSGGDEPTRSFDDGSDETTNGAEPAGRLSPEQQVVEHGPSAGDLERLLSSAPFYDGDVLRVSQGGQLLLEMGDFLWLRLFNDTSLEVLAAEVDGRTPRDVRFALEDGGFVGELTAEGGEISYELPNGVTVTVQGTTFFVVYDPDAALATVGNFSGRITVDDGSGSPVILPDRSLIESPGGTVEPLPLTLAVFERRAETLSSPIDAAHEAACPTLEKIDLTTTDLPDGVQLDWESVGGCDPFSGTITARFEDDNDSYATYDLETSSGSILDKPPLACEGTVNIIYTMTLRDALGREVTTTANQQIFVVC